MQDIEDIVAAINKLTQTIASFEEELRELQKQIGIIEEWIQSPSPPEDWAEEQEGISRPANRVFNGGF